MCSPFFFWIYFFFFPFFIWIPSDCWNYETRGCLQSRSSIQHLCICISHPEAARWSESLGCPWKPSPLQKLCSINLPLSFIIEHRKSCLCRWECLCGRLYTSLHPKRNIYSGWRCEIETYTAWNQLFKTNSYTTFLCLWNKRDRPLGSLEESRFLTGISSVLKSSG